MTHKELHDAARLALQCERDRFADEVKLWRERAERAKERP